jgi:aminoglycoside phosphotransferase (APT) family kinase protein
VLEEVTDEIRSQLEPHWERAFAYVEKTLGGKIVRARVHPRWRPAYYLDVEVDGDIVPLYFRGDRGHLDHGVYPLDHEYRVLTALEKHGIPVPHVYGFCEDPRGIVMARIEGRPDLSTAESPEEAQTLLDEFIDIMARMHQIDVNELGELGIKLPQSAEEMALGDFARWDKTFRSHKVRPDPLIEFLTRWVRGNVPQGRTQVSLLQGDAGQFLFDKGRVTTMIDLELAYFGDPAADLAGLFARDLSEPMPSLDRAIERYGERTGKPVDRRVVMYHGVRFGLCTPQSVAHLVAEPTADLEFIQYLAWYWVYARAPIEWVAQLEGIPLEPWSPPAESPSRHHAGHDFLGKAIAALPANDSMAEYQRGVVARAAVYLERADRFGPALEEEDLSEAAAILGYRPATWQECDAALEKIVLEEEPDPARDAALVKLFYRRCLRNEWLMQPVLKELTDVSFQTLTL